MAFPLEIWMLGGGISAATIVSGVWWNFQSGKRAMRETENLKKNTPVAKDGILVASLVVEIVVPGLEIKGSRNRPPQWMTELSKQLDEKVEAIGLKPIGTFYTTYMVVANDETVAQVSLQKLAKLALDLKDHIQLFSAMRDLGAAAKLGIHADIVPTLGIGSTVALSGMWSLTLHLADRANLNTIELSDQASEWLGAEFDIRRMEDKPVLYGTKAA